MRIRRLLLAGAAVLALAVPVTTAGTAHAAAGQPASVSAAAVTNPNAAGPAAAQPGASMTLKPAVLTPAEQQAASKLATPATASAWYTVYLKSQHNQLCAVGQTATHLAPIFVYNCSTGGYWRCRVLNTFNGWTWTSVGIDVECGDPTLSFVFGESGGAYKMQTPNTSQFITTTAADSFFLKMQMYPDGNYFGSGPANTQLGVETSEADGYYWAFCGTYNGCT
jgi:hypothetical protein